MHFAEAVETFRTQLQANQRSRHTVSSYMRDIAMLRGWLEREKRPLNVEIITPSTLLQFAVSPACTHKEDGRPRLPSSVDKVKMSVRAFFGFLFEAALINRNPALVLKYRRGRESVRETLTEDEAKRLVTAAAGRFAERDRLILELLLGTGVRLESLVALDVADLRLEERRLVLRRMKGGNEAAKEIPAGLVARLRYHLWGRNGVDTDSPALFLSNRGLRLSMRQIQAMLEKAARRAEITKRVTPHMCRRTYARRLYGRTKDILHVQRALDHRSVVTTMRYAANRR